MTQPFGHNIFRSVVSIFFFFSRHRGSLSARVGSRLRVGLIRTRDYSLGLIILRTDFDLLCLAQRERFHRCSDGRDSCQETSQRSDQHTSGPAHSLIRLLTPPNSASALCCLGLIHSLAWLMRPSPTRWDRDNNERHRRGRRQKITRLQPERRSKSVSRLSAARLCCCNFDFISHLRWEKRSTLIPLNMVSALFFFFF